MLPTDEDLVLPHFEDALLDRLHEEQQAGAYRPRRHRRPARPLVLVGAVAAATVLVAGVALVQGGDDPPTDVGTGNPSEAGQTDPELPDRVLAALDEALPHSIVHTNDPADGVEVWSDPTSLAERRIVRVSDIPDKSIDWGRSVAPDLDDRWTDDVPTRWLDHCRKEYSDKISPALSLGDAAQTIRGGLERGSYVADGTEVVDGRELLRLAAVPAPPPTVPEASSEEEQAQAEATRSEAEAEARRAEAEAADAEAEAADAEAARDAGAAATGVVVYVDPATDLPVLWVTREGDGETIEFLPRTAENMALLVPPVPEGYTKVAEPATDEARAGGCR